ncbi:UDP-N-acetylglucosamine 1-carboxyvinyltransferase [Candidatus Saccharibacteria bacterium]|nr:UDP-N-acetylglucosamine 1-carboxyvinyltransferase [Candidatus Saccharibacteria bacterium]MCL1963037.1 UDP-N-acetylglucosamine 1-carboxyvinyltransferase [Candidatus Saccharibacteria bacterium]
MEKNYREKIGRLVAELRINHNLTQAELAAKLNTSQSAINRIEKGTQNISLEIIARISDVLNSEILSVNNEGKLNLRVRGGRKLRGEITVNTSKNAAVGLLCASLLNKGKTTLYRVARIEEVNRILEVLNSIGVKTRWLNDKDLEIIPPRRLKLSEMDINAAKKTRSIIMFLGPLLHQYRDFKIPFAGGCHLGKRTVEPHLEALAPFGLRVDAATGTDFYHAKVIPKKASGTIVLTERGNTTSENLLMAAALNDGVTVARNVSNDYMVLDVCYYLQKLGVEIEGVGGTNLKITGLPEINKDIEYYLSEDPIEAVSLIAAGVVTGSEITVKRVPIEMIDVELAVLKTMGLKFETSASYLSHNGQTVLADITIKKSTLTAPKDKIAGFPSSINMDNLPFLGLIAATASGSTLLHDWAYENRAIYFTELSKLNADIELIDPHRVYFNGPTHWRAADVVAPPALRPSVVVLLAMLAADGTSILRDVYNINRGYEDLYQRLNSLGAKIEIFRDI